MWRAYLVIQVRKPMLGFGPCVEPEIDAEPLIVRWKSGELVGGILGPLAPEWMKAHQHELAAREELRAEPNVIILKEYKNGC